MENDGIGEEYVCAMCGKTYEKGVPDSEAMAEANEYWPTLKQEEAAIVCDDCYQGIKPEEHPAEYAESLLEDSLTDEEGAFIEDTAKKIIKEILYGK